MVKLNIAAVTACISGVAHTYMAAEYLEKLAHQENWLIKVETQGALGIENRLTNDDVINSDLVLIVSNANIKHKERFEKQRCLTIDISQFLLSDKETILKQIKKILNQPKGYHI